MPGSLLCQHLPTQCTTSGVCCGTSEQARPSVCSGGPRISSFIGGRAHDRGFEQCERAGSQRTEAVLGLHEGLSKASRLASHCSAGNFGRTNFLRSTPHTPPSTLSVQHQRRAKDKTRHPAARSTLATESPPAVPIEPVEWVEKTLALPLDLYQVLGADTHFLADAISRSYEARLATPLHEAFSTEATLAREEILRAARDTLAQPELRQEYNRSLAEDEAGTIVVDIPWSKVAGALCILLETGEKEIVLQAGQSVLDDESSGSVRSDVKLAMALAHVELSQEALAQTPTAIVPSCRHLDAALKLLQEQEESEGRFAPSLQNQISRTLDEIRPQCVLELLALPLEEENAELRADGLKGLRNLLWADGVSYGPLGGGYMRDEYLKEAFQHMTALEQVELYTETPITIPAEPSEVYSAALAHIAEGFAGKKPRLVKEADSLFSQLQQTNGAVGDFRTTDRPLEFSVERAMCALLLGEVGDCRAWLDIDGNNPNLRDPSIIEYVYAHSEGLAEGDDLPGLCQLLENWLAEEVFPKFREMEGLQAAIGDYYDDPVVLQYLESSELQGSPLAAIALAKIGQGAGAALHNVKATLQRVFPLGKKIQDSVPAADINRNQLSFQKTSEHLQEESENEDEQLFFPAAAGSPEVISRLAREGNGSVAPAESLSPIKRDHRLPIGRIACAGVIVGALLFARSRYSTLEQQWKQLRGQPAPSGSSFVSPVQIEKFQQPDQWSKMDATVADYLIRKWQTIKARALGPNHTATQLSEVLEGEMLKSWMDRVNNVAKQGWFWEYNLLDLNIDSVTVSPDGKKAIVEATLQEYAKLYDNGHPEHNDSYRSTYTTRYDLRCGDDGWRIAGGAVLRN